MTEMANAGPEPPPGGWLLVEDQAVFDVSAMLERYGQVYRYPIPDSDRVPLMAPGQPCSLLRTDRSKVVGLWAMGEVVGPCAPLADDASGWSAEVVLLPLAKPLPLAKLTAHGDLADGLLEDLGAAVNPVPLTRRQLRAIESFDVWIDEPSEEQHQLLDELLAAEESAEG